jgi:RNA polymerase sigma factor (sigma-70 family)
MDARALLEQNLELIERVIRFIARRKQLDESECEEFASIVKLKLVENDYAVIRAFKGTSKFRTYMVTVVTRALLDYRIHHWGKWHASADAKRLGDVAVELEQLLHRDGRSIDEALPVLQARHPETTREMLESIAGGLPERRARRRMVDLSEAEGVAGENDDIEEPLKMSERERTSKRLSSAMRQAISQIPAHDRLLLQLRFDSGMTVAQIARAMQIEQKLLYRRFDKLLRDLGEELVRAGIDRRDAADLIGREGAQLDFALGTPEKSPSEEIEGSVAARGKKKVSR